jgi:hypothetical protein
MWLWPYYYMLLGIRFLEVTFYCFYLNHFFTTGTGMGYFKLDINERIASRIKPRVITLAIKAFS